MICPYCKETIQDDALKCRHCGSTLGSGYTGYDASSPSDEELRAFLGKNADFYLRSFLNFTVSGRERFALTWNWPACFFPFIWMLYRRMYVQGVVTFLIFCIPGINVLLHLATGAVGNYLYYRHARARILETRSYQSPQNLLPVLQQLGGVHDWAIPVGIAMLAIAILVFSFFFALFSTLILHALHTPHP